MTSTESQQPTRDDYVRWGTAPEDRQCRYTFASGYHCRRWSIRGHEYCNQHGRWMECRVDGPIEVPLMEDSQAVQLVASQTARSVGWGQIPPANGRAILHSCRVVQTGFAQDLALAKFLLKCHTLGADPRQFLPARLATQFSPPPPNPEAQQAGAPFKPGVGLSGKPEQNRVPQVSPVLGDVEQRDSAPSKEPQPVILSEARSAESKDLHLTTPTGASAAEQNRVPHVSPVLGDMGERDSTPSKEPQPVILSEARSAESKDLHLTGTPNTAPNPSSDLIGIDTSAAASAPAQPLTASPLAASPLAASPLAASPLTASSLTASSHPLDDLPPAPRPKSVCEPCADALVQGADESLLDCKHCPAARAGNLRAPQHPDPRNPPEPACDPRTTPSPRRPAFQNLKTKWDAALDRFEGQCAGNRYPKRYPLQTEKEYADERAAMRARPFDDYLRPPGTSPPPPILKPDAR